jgi:hypothetical protein
MRSHRAPSCANPGQDVLNVPRAARRATQPVDRLVQGCMPAPPVKQGIDPERGVIAARQASRPRRAAWRRHPHAGEDRQSVWTAPAHAANIKGTRRERKAGPAATCPGNEGPRRSPAHVAPPGRQHIALAGNYIWAAPDPAMPFRPLRDIHNVFLDLVTAERVAEGCRFRRADSSSRQ